MRSSRWFSVPSLLGVLGALGTCACGSASQPSGSAPETATPGAALQSAARIVRADRALTRRLAPTRAGFAPMGDALASIAARTPTESLVPALRTRVGRHADDAWDLGLAGGEQPPRVRLLPEGLASSEATLDAGRVIYRDVCPSTDAIVVSDAISSELLYVLRDAAAPTRFGFRVERPAATGGPAAGAALEARAEDDGGVSFVDPGGAVRLAIAPPFAIDATGARRAARLSLTQDTAGGERLSLELDAHGLAFPIVLDPYVGTARWTRIAVDPPARGEAKLASLGSKLVLVGGSSGTAVLGDTWEWDGTAWARRSTPTTPLPRSYFSLATLGSRVVLFGGLDAAGALHDDTWTWDGATWTKLAPAHKPPARRWAATTALGSKLVLFGGVGATGALADTWEFDGTDWAQRTTPTAPPGGANVRLGAASATSVVAIGTTSSAGPWQTWTWDGTSWTDRTATAPSAFFSPLVANAGGTLRVVDFGAPGGLIVWDWSGSSWGPHGIATAPPDRRAPAVASLGGSLVIFGGYTGSGYATLGDLWKYDGASDFALQVPKSAPSARRFPSGATLDDRFVVFGGLADDGEHDDTWEWDGVRWTQASPAARPGKRFGGAFADAGSVALLYGGDFGGLADAWSWNHTTWTPVATPATIPPLGAPSLTRVGSANVLFDASPGTFGGAWIWNGTSFAPAPATPAPMGNGLFGAHAGHGVFVDLSFGEQWRWDPAGFTKEPSANAQDLPWIGRDLDPISLDATHSVELGRFLVSMIDDAKSGSGLRNEAWLWDGARWGAVALTGLPLRTSYALGKQGSTLVLFGGDDDSFVPTNDTYVLSLSLASAAACKSDAECDTVHCADGVCCNRACAGTCEACDLPGTAGTCSPVVGAPKHGSCPAAGADPCSQALCDGKTASACKAFVGASVSCRASTCAAGGDVAAASCNGSGACPAVVAHRCSPFACGASACKDACRVDGDCESGLHCEATTGRCLAGATCIDDRTLAGVDGTKQACSPYRCAASACLTGCSTSDDCLGGYACDTATRACIPAGGSTNAASGGCSMAITSASSESGGASASGTTDSAGIGAWSLLGAVGLAGARLRRARRR
jgi:hypothetical protein